MDIHPLTGEFLSAAKEASFLEHKQEQTRALLGFTLTFCTVFYLGFFATDLAVLGWGDAAQWLLGPRMLVALATGTCAWLTYRRPLSVRATRLAATIAESVALGCFMFISAQRPAEFHWHAMSLAIMLVVVYLYIPNRLSYAAAISVLATAGFVLLATQYLSLSFADILTMGMLLVLVNTFGFLAARRYNHVSREEFRSHSVLKYAAERDHLTGCFNRRYLHYQLIKLWRGQRPPGAGSVRRCDARRHCRRRRAYVSGQTQWARPRRIPAARHARTGLLTGQRPSPWRPFLTIGISQLFSPRRSRQIQR